MQGAEPHGLAGVGLSRADLRLVYGGFLGMAWGEAKAFPGRGEAGPDEGGGLGLVEGPAEAS